MNAINLLQVPQTTSETSDTPPAARRLPSTAQTSTPTLVLCELRAASEIGLESHSPFCLKIHRSLRAAGLAYTSRHGSRPSVFSKLNPRAQVPVLLVDGQPIVDSSAILSYIVDARPGTISATAEEWLMEDWADTSLNGFLVASRWADDRNWDRVRQAYFAEAPWFVRTLVAPMLRRKVVSTLVARDVWRGGAEACWTSFERTLDRLDTRVRRHAFFSGPRLSVADLAIFGQLHSLRTELTPWQRDAVLARPGLSRYLDHVNEATAV